MNTTAAFTPPSSAHLGLTFAHAPVFLLFGAIALPLSYFLLRGTNDGKVNDLGGIPLWTAWTFFTQRYEFMQHHLARGGMFRFRVLQHRILGATGLKGRKSFFNEKHFDMEEGFKILQGGIPAMEDAGKDSEGTVTQFIKYLHTMMKTENLESNLPLLLSDLNRRVTSWGKQGTIDPFEDVYNLVFQMTIRLSTCDALATDSNTVAAAREHFWGTQEGATPASVLLPWLPSQSGKIKEKASMDLYVLLMRYVMERRHAGGSGTEPIDFLMKEGMTDEYIIGFIFTFLFVGIVNTGVTICWILLYLEKDQTWKLRAQTEIEALILKYNGAPSLDPLHIQLANIPLSGWEDELPAFESIIRETLRLTLGGHTALRRNVGDDVSVDGVQVKRGEFIAYCFSEVHMDRNVYPDPGSFDPSRYDKGREEDKKVAFGYLGWGVGRHPCAGMRVAKLELKLILAMLLVGCDYTLADKYGKPPTSIPEQNRNDLRKASPLGEPVFIKFTRVRD